MNVDLNLVDMRMSDEEKKSFYDAIAKYLTISEEVIPIELYDRISSNVSDGYKVEYIEGQLFLSEMYFSNSWHSKKLESIPKEIRKMANLILIDELFDVIENEVKSNMCKKLLNKIIKIELDNSCNRYVVLVYPVQGIGICEMGDIISYIENIGNRFGYKVLVNFVK